MSSSYRRLAAWLGAIALALLVPTLVVAQSESGKVVGVVTDQSGAVLPGVSVTLKSVGRASTRATVSDSKGMYVFAGIVPGPYEVTAELSGFSTKQIKTTVTVGATVAVDVQMAVGAQTEVVTVLGESDRGHQHHDPGHRDHGQRDPDPRAAEHHPQPLRLRPALGAGDPRRAARPNGAPASPSTARARPARTS